MSGKSAKEIMELAQSLVVEPQSGHAVLKKLILNILGLNENSKIRL